MKQDNSAGSFYYVHDRLGSVRLVIDASANVKNRYTYQPFGKLFATETEENVLNPFKFTGQYFDSETGWYYNRARMYDPLLGRFTSYDPVFGKLHMPLTLNKYLYCKNNPINLIDPSGEWAVYMTTTGMASFGQSVVGQFGFAWDDNHNFEDIAIGGWGGGTPSVSGGISIGWAPFADTVYDLKGMGVAAGGSVKGVGLEVFMSDKIGMGIEITISTALLLDYIPMELHGHITGTQVGLISGAVSDYIFEEGFYNATTWGEGTAMLSLGAILGQ